MNTPYYEAVKFKRMKKLFEKFTLTINRFKKPFHDFFKTIFFFFLCRLHICRSGIKYRIYSIKQNEGNKNMEYISNIILYFSKNIL